MQKEDKKIHYFSHKKTLTEATTHERKDKQTVEGNSVYLLGRWGERLCVCGHGHSDVCSTQGQADHNTVLGKHALCESVCLYV